MSSNYYRITYSNINSKGRIMSYSNITKGLKNKISNFDNVQNLEFSFFQPSNKLHK